MAAVGWLKFAIESIFLSILKITVQSTPVKDVCLQFFGKIKIKIQKMKEKLNDKEKEEKKPKPEKRRHKKNAHQNLHIVHYQLLVF